MGGVGGVLLIYFLPGLMIHSCCHMCSVVIYMRLRSMATPPLRYHNQGHRLHMCPLPWEIVWETADSAPLSLLSFFDFCLIALNRNLKWTPDRGAFPVFVSLVVHPPGTRKQRINPHYKNTTANLKHKTTLLLRLSPNPSHANIQSPPKVLEQQGQFLRFCFPLNAIEFEAFLKSCCPRSVPLGWWVKRWIVLNSTLSFSLGYLF